MVQKRKKNHNETLNLVKLFNAVAFQKKKNLWNGWRFSTIAFFFILLYLTEWNKFFVEHACAKTQYNISLQTYSSFSLNTRTIYRIHRCWMLTQVNWDTNKSRKRIQMVFLSNIFNVWLLCVCFFFSIFASVCALMLRVIFLFFLLSLILCMIHITHLWCYPMLCGCVKSKVIHKNQ